MASKKDHSSEVKKHQNRPNDKNKKINLKFKDWLSIILIIKTISDLINDNLLI
jgi:hypothetical protein